MNQEINNYLLQSVISISSFNSMINQQNQGGNSFDRFIKGNNIKYIPFNKELNNKVINNFIEKITETDKDVFPILKKTVIKSREVTIDEANKKLALYKFSCNNQNKVNKLIFYYFNKYLIKKEKMEDRNIVNISEILRANHGAFDAPLFCYIFSFKELADLYIDFIASYLKTIIRVIIKKLKIIDEMECFKLKHYIECFYLIYG